jgi:hypothetical protein
VHAGQRHHQLHRLAVAGAGVAVGPEGEGDAGVAEHLDGRRPAGAQQEARARQQDRHGTGRRQRLRLLLTAEQQVVGGDAAELGGQHGPAGGAELVGVELEPEAVAAARLQHAAGLLHRQRAPVAEGVHEAGQRRAHRQHLALQQRQVGVPVGGELGRDQVGAEEGRDHLDREPRGQRGEHLQRAALVVDGEAVPGLGLQRGRAVPGGLDQPPGGGGLQLGVAGGPGLADRAVDAAPGGQRLLVADPAQAGGELLGAVAGEHQVGVRVDEPGQDGMSTHVQPGGVRGDLQVGQAALGTGVHHGPSRRRHRPALDQPERPLPQGRVAGGELARPGQEEVHRHHVAPGRSRPRSRATARARS